MAWSGPRSFRRAIPWRGACARARSRRRAITTKAAPRRSVPSGFAALRGKLSASPRCIRRAGLVPGAQRAGRLFRRADCGAEIHQGLGEVARAGRRREPARQFPNRRLGGRQFLLAGIKPRDHALNIAVDGRRALIERDRCDRRRRVGAEPRQLRRAPLRVCGKRPPCCATITCAQACRLRARA